MGPTFSRSIFPFPESTSTKQQAPYFQAPPRLSYRSLLPATPRLCSYEPLISTVIPPLPPPPNLPLSENVLPPFLDAVQKHGVFFIRSSTQLQKFLPLNNILLLNGKANFASRHFLFPPTMIRSRKLRGCAC